MRISSRPKKSILLVEDEVSIRTLLAKTLVRRGYILYEASDGNEGLRLAKSKHPDLLLVDIVLPRMDGITMMRRVREEGTWGKKVPVIVLTNMSPEHFNTRLRHIPHSVYLIKAEHSVRAVLRAVVKCLKGDR